jgi:hypothetical protein
MMNAKQISRTLCALVLMGCLTSTAQEAEHTESAPAIESFAWIAGHWRGEGLGGEFEETWNPPFGNSMVGMFKLVQENEVAFYEILTIVKMEKSWVLRLKHFDKTLVGWEEKDKSVEFPFVSVSETEVVFEGLKFTKVDANTMHVVVRVEQGDEPEDLKFVFKKVEQATK